jgi:CheY-like chemotaxis protein
MNAIMGFSAFLKDKTLDAEKISQYLQIITDSSTQLLSIITDIINIATIEAGKESIHNENFNLNALLKSVYAQYQLITDKKNIQFNYMFEFEDIHSNMYSDETKLLGVVSNIINNAIKFTENGHISFGYKKKAYELEFFVDDSGKGIPSTMIDVIFERFRQVETSKEKLYSGTGLGLSISKSYIELLGGKIWVESEQGKGSTFYFTIPYNNSITDTKKTITQDLTGMSHKTILIAEDEDYNYVLLQEYFSKLSINIVRARNGLEAITKCNEQRFDLILMDIKMPVLNGIDASIHIKEKYPDCKIIAQTAFSHGKELDNALTSGMIDVLIKPITFDRLLEVLQKHLL